MFLSFGSLGELYGLFGDIGTFLSYTIPLSQKSIVHFPSVLLYSGICNIITGYYFNIPLPIQPQSTLASIAITSDSLTSSSFGISGFITGLIVGVLGLFNIIQILNQYIPKVCIYAIQTGLGLNLLIKGIKDCKTHGHIWDVILLSMLIAIKWRPYTSSRVQYVINGIPFALLLFMIGIIMSISISGFQPLSIDFPYTILEISDSNDWKNAFIEGTLSQLPVTILNSIISTVDLSYYYFKEDASKVTLRSVSISIACMNSLNFIGNIPSCHGAGGIVSQHYAGARKGISMIWLGWLKIVLAIFCGKAMTIILSSFPVTIIGIMLGYTGLELVKVSLTKVDKKDIIPFIISVGTILSINPYVGFIVGIIVKLWCTNMENNNYMEETEDML